MTENNWCTRGFENAKAVILSLRSPVTRRRLVIAVLAGFSAGVVIAQLNYSFGVFVPYWDDEFSAWTRTEINTSFAIAQVTSAIAGLVMGFLIDRYGARKVVTLCLLLVAGGFSIISLIPAQEDGGSIYQLWGGYLVIGLGYCGTSVLGGGKVIGTWFPGPKRGRVMGIVTASNNLFGSIMVQTSSAIALGTDSWRASSWTFTGIVCGLSILYWIGIRDEPPAWFQDYQDQEPRSSKDLTDACRSNDGVGIKPSVDEEAIADIDVEAHYSLDENHTRDTAEFCIQDQIIKTSVEERSDAEGSDSARVSVQDDTEDIDFKIQENTQSDAPSSSISGNSDDAEWTLKYSLTTYIFWTTTIGMLCAYWTFAGVLSQLIPALIAEGFTNAEAANTVSVVAIAGIVSKITCGRISEILSARVTLMAILVVQAIAITIFVTTQENRSPVYTGACILYGLSFGGVGAMLPLVALETFGVEHYGKIYGLQSMFFIVPSLGGPIIAGRSLDDTQSYKTSLIVSACVLVTGAVFLWLGKIGLKKSA